MKRYTKSYHMFLPARAWVKLLVYLLYPVITVAGIYVMYRMFKYYPYISIGFACGLIVMAEILLDYFVFGGIASKDTNCFEYLKTSVKGIPLLKMSLTADAGRRFCSVLVILSGSYAVVYGNGTKQTNFIWQMAACILCTYLLTEAGLLITRYVASWTVNLVVMNILCGVAFLAGVFTLSCRIPAWAEFLLAATALGVAVMGRALIIKRVRESYYDK